MTVNVRPYRKRDGTPVSGYRRRAPTRKWVGAGAFVVALVDDDTQPARDRYQRLLAYVTVAGRDVGRQLVAEGDAREYHRSGPRPTTRPRAEPRPLASVSGATADEPASPASQVGMVEQVRLVNQKVDSCPNAANPASLHLAEPLRTVHHVSSDHR